MVKDDENNNMIGIVSKLMIWGTIGVLFLFVTFSVFFTVPAGNRGVMLTFEKPSMEELQEGLGVKVPIVQDVVLVNVRTQTYKATASAATKDMQDVSTDVSVIFHIDPERAAELYQRVGDGYQTKIIEPMVQDSVKRYTAGMNAYELVKRQNESNSLAFDGLKEKAMDYGIIIEGTPLMTNFKFSQEFNDVIEATQIQEQKVKEANNTLQRITVEAQQKVAQAEADAKSAIFQAEGIANSTMLKAEADAKAILVVADAQAKAFELKKKQLDSSMLKLEYYDKVLSRWDGKLPVTFSGSNGALPIVPIDLNITG